MANRLPGTDTVVSTRLGPRTVEYNRPGGAFILGKYPFPPFPVLGETEVRPLGLLLGVCLAMGLVLAGTPATAVAQQELDALAQQVAQDLKTAGRLGLQGKGQEAVAALQRAQENLHRLAATKTPQARRSFRRLEAQLRVVRRVLKRKGVPLPPVPDFSKPPSKPLPSAGQVSFVKDVAPILVARCRNCHINNARGQFSMATFAALARGVGGASVIDPGSARTSRLIELLEKGEMPQNGRKLTRQQIDTIRRWIDQGARFDGPRPDAPLVSLVPQSGASARPRLVKATGKEKVRFTRDLAPVLVSQCADCHGGRRPRARLRLDTFAGLLRGSPNGPVLVQGKPQQSLLIQKLRGTADGERMPAGGRDPLPEETIKLFETWIAEGARFDGPNENMPLATLVQIERARKATHQELSKQREELALKNWRLANPGLEYQRWETTNFLLLGNVPEEQLKQVAQVAEEQLAKIASLLKLKKSKPLIRGRMTLFVFRRRFQLSEFSRMVLRAELPFATRAFWRWSVVDAYGCLLPPTADANDPQLRGLVTETVAGLLAESLGTGVPRWFAQGFSLAAVKRLVKKDPRVPGWEDLLPEAVAACSSPKDLIAGNMALEHARVLHLGLVEALLGHRGFSTLVRRLQAGQEFEQAFAAAFRASPEQLAAAWIRRAASGR